MDEWITLYEYLNKFADNKKYADQNAQFKEGYKQACKDIFNKVESGKLIIESSIKRIIIMEEKK